jgi:adenylate cyclase
MSAALSIRVFDQNALQFTAECPNSIEIGRDRGGEQVGKVVTNSAGTRLVIAAGDERTIARDQARIAASAQNRIRLTNLSDKVLICFATGEPLPPGAWRDLPLPIEFTVGVKTVRVQRPEEESGAGLTSLAEVSVPISRTTRAVSRFPALGGPVDPREFIRWLQSVLGVLQSAAGSDDFFAGAARAAADIVGLDDAWVLLPDVTGEWRPFPQAVGALPPSRSLIQRVRTEKRTFWGHPRDAAEGASLARIQAAVAAPILGSTGAVVGVLYGVRWLTPDRMQTGTVTEVEARLVELLAGAVGAGLARLEEEKRASTARIRYEEFLTPELARHLLEQPDRLAGRAAEITVLFADIRGFSGVCEKLGPSETVLWVSDVFAELSECVRAESGVLVDYIGDELLAMWGVPVDQPDQADRACRAARAMLGHLPALNERWEKTIGRPVAIGIGIHTGTAHVGNIGTRYKFKYGPLGPTPNLASRVEGATKYLRVPLLITGTTRAKLSEGFATRRLTRVKVVNIAEPVDLVELPADVPESWNELRDGYEAALADFEGGRMLDATHRLGPLLVAHPNDGPALLLLTRAVQALQPNAPPFDPVWVLPGK